MAARRRAGRARRRRIEPHAGGQHLGVDAAAGEVGAQGFAPQRDAARLPGTGPAPLPGRRREMRKRLAARFTAAGERPSDRQLARPRGSRARAGGGCRSWSAGRTPRDSICHPQSESA